MAASSTERRWSVLALSLSASAFAVGCGATGHDTRDPTRPTPEPEVVLGPKVASKPGRLLALRLDLTAGDTQMHDAVLAWFGEAIGQSAWLDVALDTAAPRDADTLVLRGELGAASTLTTTLLLNGQHAAPVPLAGVERFVREDLIAAIDRLAIDTRRTLGEPTASVSASSRSAAVLVSADERVAAACARATELARERRLGPAEAGLSRALRIDPSCALALSLSAGILMDQGLADRAVERARRVTTLEARASPAARHRAERTLLLAAKRYGELVELAEQRALERPHDAQIRFSRALGLCMLGRLGEALPSLRALHARLPDSPGVVFCLGHALLAAGELKDALALMDEVEARVPALPAARLHAWVLFAQARWPELEDLLQSLERRGAFRVRAGELLLLSMRAAVAIAREDDATASRLLLDLLDRLRAAPSVLAEDPALLVDAAWTLARLGKGKECAEALAMLRGPQGFAPPVRAEGMVADAVVRLDTGAELDDASLAHFDTIGRRAWRARLEAGRALRAGNPARARELLKLAATASEDPALVWEIARVERALGNVEVASRLLRAASSALAEPRMDQPEQHPLMSPKLAFVWRSGR